LKPRNISTLQRVPIGSIISGCACEHMHADNRATHVFAMASCDSSLRSACAQSRRASARHSQLAFATGAFTAGLDHWSHSGLPLGRPPRRQYCHSGLPLGRAPTSGSALPFRLATRPPTSGSARAPATRRRKDRRSQSKPPAARAPSRSSTRAPWPLARTFWGKVPHSPGHCCADFLGSPIAFLKVVLFST
jgi:hypothetical protein